MTVSYSIGKTKQLGLCAGFGHHVYTTIKTVGAQTVYTRCLVALFGLVQPLHVVAMVDEASQLRN